MQGGHGLQAVDDRVVLLPALSDNPSSNAPIDDGDQLESVHGDG
jgi:hypothetical protein